MSEPEGAALLSEDIEPKASASTGKAAQVTPAALVGGTRASIPPSMPPSAPPNLAPAAMPALPAAITGSSSSTGFHLTDAMGLGKTVQINLMLQHLLSECRRLSWVAEQPDVCLLQLRDGHALEVAPGTGIATGDVILLAYVPRVYQTLFWADLLNLELADGHGPWEKRVNGSKQNGGVQNYTLSVTAAQVKNPKDSIMIALRRKSKAEDTTILARCYRALIRGLEDLVELGARNMFLRYTPEQDYPQMTDADAFCPKTMGGKLHENLPVCHGDSGLSDDRNIEGMGLNCGDKAVRLTAWLKGLTATSSILAAYAILMRGPQGGGFCKRYSFVKQPEDGQLTRSSGAAPYSLKEPLQVDGADLSSASQFHQAVLLQPAKLAAGCGEFQGVWDAKQGFPYEEAMARKEAYRTSDFPEAQTDDLSVGLDGFPKTQPIRLAKKWASKAEDGEQSECTGRATGARQRSQQECHSGGVSATQQQQDLSTRFLDGRLPFNVEGAGDKLTLLAVATLRREAPGAEEKKTIAFWEEALIELQKVSPEKLAAFRADWEKMQHGGAGGALPAPALHHMPTPTRQAMPRLPCPPLPWLC